MKTTTRRLLEIYGVGTDARPHDQELDEQGGDGLRITGDPATVNALCRIFQAAMDDVVDDYTIGQWAKSAYSALESAKQRGDGNVTLPKFQGQAGDGTNGEEETP